MARAFTFGIKGKSTAFDVLDFRGAEALSEAYSFDVYLTCDRAAAFQPEGRKWYESVLGQKATLSFSWFGHTRYVHGIVSQLELSGAGDSRVIVRVVLASELARLTQTRQSRIFQAMTTKDIVAQILKEHQIDKVEWSSLTEKYSPRNFCVQYRESDYDFMCRLLEEEGIAFFFRHEQDAVTLCFTDTTAAFKPIEGEATLAVQGRNSGMQRQTESCTGVVLQQSIRPKTVILKDYAFKNPKLECSATAKRETDLEGCVYDYPGEFVEPDLGKRLATVRMEELEASKVVATSGSDSTRLEPGRKLKTSGCGDASLDHEWLVVRINHNGTQPQASEQSGSGGHNSYHNSLTLAPADMPFRPPRVTPRPVVLGTHSATVSGPKGETSPTSEEIYTDSHGRVQVRFHWDREGGSAGASCWVRVAQTGAGAGWGMVDIPRIGHEVLVTFLEGDPDRPVIVGRVYNGGNPVPYPLPEHKTRMGFRTNSTGKTGGYNEFMFDDKGGSELLRIRAQKDLVKNVLANETERTGDCRAIEVAHTLNINASEINITAKRININGAEVTDVKGGVIKLNC